MHVFISHQQVLFLDIAMPPGMSRDQIIKRYDDNCGFPTDKMVTEMKAACTKIENMKTYDDWFKVSKSMIISLCDLWPQDFSPFHKVWD